MRHLDLFTGILGFAYAAQQVWKDEYEPVAFCLCRMDDGISNRVDRLKSLGNSIVPQIAMVIMEATKEIEKGSITDDTDNNTKRD